MEVSDCISLSLISSKKITFLRCFRKANALHQGQNNLKKWWVSYADWIEHNLFPHMESQYSDHQGKETTVTSI